MTKNELIIIPWNMEHPQATGKKQIIDKIIKFIGIIKKMALPSLIVVRVYLRTITVKIYNSSMLYTTHKFGRFTQAGNRNI